MGVSFNIDYRRGVHDEMFWDDLVPEWSDIVFLLKNSGLVLRKRGRERGRRFLIWISR
jgi:hypothetical protein